MLFGLNNGGAAGFGFDPLKNGIMPPDGLIGLEHPFLQGQALPHNPNSIPVEPGGAALQPSPMPSAPTARMSADQLALRQKANAGWKPDYSPVQHWAQGLGRVADGLSHGIEQRRLEKEAVAIETDKANSVAALLARGTSQSSSPASPVAAALSSSDPMMQKLGIWKLEQDKPKPTQPHYWETNNGSLFAVGPDAQPREVYHDPSPKMNFIPDGLGGGQWVAVPGQTPTPAGGPAPPAIGAVMPDPRRGQGGGAGDSAGGFR